MTSAKKSFKWQCDYKDKPINKTQKTRTYIKVHMVFMLTTLKFDNFPDLGLKQHFMTYFPKDSKARHKSLRKHTDLE